MPEAILTKTPPPYSERLFFLAMKGYSPGGGGGGGGFGFLFEKHPPPPTGPSKSYGPD